MSTVQPRRPRQGGRHPDAVEVVVRLTVPALADLERIRDKGDRQIVRMVLKKMLVIQRNPEVGAPLRGGLAGFRKITVGDRHWRVIWRVTHEDAGKVIIDVAEIWAIGSRSDAAVYAEMTERVATLRKNPRTVSLAQTIEELGKIAYGIVPQSELSPSEEAIADWLVNVLVSVVGMPESEVIKLTPQEAESLWGAYTRRRR